MYKDSRGAGSLESQESALKTETFGKTESFGKHAAGGRPDGWNLWWQVPSKSKYSVCVARARGVAKESKSLPHLMGV